MSEHHDHMSATGARDGTARPDPPPLPSGPAVVVNVAGSPGPPNGPRRGLLVAGLYGLLCLLHAAGTPRDQLMALIYLLLAVLDFKEGDPPPRNPSS